MALPKYLPVKKKIPYTVRLPEHLLNSLNAYADLTGNTTTNVVIDVLTDFMKDKTVFNDYLIDRGSKTIKIPLNADAKENIIANDNLNSNLLNTFNGNISYYDENNCYEEAVKPTETATIEIKRIPNNLDVFNRYSYESGSRYKHKGIEFFVYIPKEYEIVWNYIDYLYCFYFEVTGNETNICLIDNLDAINRLADADTTTKDLLIGCIKELEFISDIGNGCENELYDDFLSIARKYNTGNIVEFGADIEKRIEINDAENKLGSDPKLIEYLLSKINQLEAHEKSMTEIIEKLQNKPE